MELDRFMRGFIAGVAAAVAKDALNWLSYGLHIAKHTYAEYAYALLAGHEAVGAVDFAVGQAFELGIGGAIGVLFTYYAYRTHSKRNLWFKGIFFAIGVYFTTYFTGTLFRLPVFGVPDTVTIASNLITSTIDGALLGLFTAWWATRRGDWGAGDKSEAKKPDHRPAKAIGRPVRTIRYCDSMKPAEDTGDAGVHRTHLRRPRKLH